MELNFFKNKIVHLAAFLCVLSSTMQAGESTREAEIRKFYEDAAQEVGIPHSKMPTIILADHNNTLPAHRHHLEHENTFWIYGNTIWVNNNKFKYFIPAYKTSAKKAMEYLKQYIMQPTDSPKEAKIRELCYEAAQLHNIPKEAIPNIIFTKLKKNGAACVSDNTIFINTYPLENSFLNWLIPLNWKMIALHEMTHVKHHDIYTINKLSASEREAFNIVCERRADETACHLAACEDCIKEFGYCKTESIDPKGYMTYADCLAMAAQYKGKKCRDHCANVQTYASMIASFFYNRNQNQSIQSTPSQVAMPQPTIQPQSAINTPASVTPRPTAAPQAPVRIAPALVTPATITPKATAQPTAVNNQPVIVPLADHPMFKLLDEYNTNHAKLAISNPTTHTYNWNFDRFKAYLPPLHPVTTDQIQIITNYITRLSATDYTYLMLLAHIKKTSPEYILTSYYQTNGNTLNSTIPVIDILVWYLKMHSTKLQISQATITLETKIQTSTEPQSTLTNAAKWLQSWWS